LGLGDVSIIETHKRADLVVLKGDPMSDISAVRRVSRGFKEGNLVRFS